LGSQSREIIDNEKIHEIYNSIGGFKFDEKDNLSTVPWKYVKLED